MLPILIFLFRYQVFLVFTLIEETEGSDFNDLGKLLLGGFVAAIGVALAFTFIKLRLRDKRPPTAEFISLNAFQKKE